MEYLRYLKIAITVIIFILLIILLMNVLSMKKSLDKINNKVSQIDYNLNNINQKKAYIKSVKEKLVFFKSILGINFIYGIIKDIQINKDNKKKMTKDIVIKSIKQVPKIIK